MTRIGTAKIIALAAATAMMMTVMTMMTGFAGVAAAETRTLEVVGSIPIGSKRKAAVAPRDAAIEQALREAVVRVAQEFLADRPIELPDEGDLNRGTIDDTNPDASKVPDGAPGLEPEPADLGKILGKKMVPYTQRFRVIEDRGRKPALFAEDPDVSEEYVVIVEVQVDVERVRTKLIDAGLIRAGEIAAGSNEVRLEIEGLTAYPAYLAMRALLEGSMGSTGVYPVEMGRGRTILDVETEASAIEFLEKLLAGAPPELEIVPLHVSGNRVHVVAKWTPPPDPSPGSNGGSAKRRAGR
jgi:hypothetical protein